MAYTRLGRLIVAYDADASGFKKGSRQVRDGMRNMRQAARRLQSAMRRLGRTIGNTARRMLSLRAAVATLAGSSGLGLLIKRSADAGASLFEASTRVGIATDRFQKLQRVFEGDGVAIEKFTRSLQNFVRYANEAAGGVKSYEETFERLGVKLRDSDGNLRDVNSLLLDAADGFARLGTQSERVALAVELFGARNSAMLNVLQRGSAQLETSIDHMGRLGSWSTETSAALKVLAQAFTDAGNAWETALGNAVARAAPQLHGVLEKSIELSRQLADAMVNAVLWIINNLEEIGRVGKLLGLIFIATRRAVVTVASSVAVLATGFLTAAGGAAALRLGIARIIPTLRWLGRTLLIGLIVEAILLAIRHTDKLREVFGSVGAVVRTLGAVIDGWVAQVHAAWLETKADVISIIIDIANEFIRRMNAAIDAVRDAWDALFRRHAPVDSDDPMANQYGFGGQALAQAETERAPLIPQIAAPSADAGAVPDAVQARIDAARVAAKALRQQLRDLGDDFKDLGRAWARDWGFVDEDIEETGDGLDGNKKALAEYNAALQELIDSFGKLGDAGPPALEATEKATEKASKSMAEAKEKVAEVATRIGDSFGRAVEDIITGAAKASDAMRALVADIIRAVLRAVVINPLVGAITTGINTFVGGLFAPAAPTTGPGFAQLQHGGPAMSGRPYMVGERGPEMFIPSRDGHVISNADLGGSGGGGGNVINFAPVINGGDPAMVRMEIQRAFPAFRDLVESEILRKQNRPSAHRQAILST